VSEDLFPSGPWTGFYNYSPPARHQMDLHLAFANGQMTGDGHDDVGRFLIKGRYDVSNRECWWTKSYPGSHDVAYRGYREGKGIWGTWEIGLWAHGGFHIWPHTADEGETKTQAIPEEHPVDAIGTLVGGTPASNPLSSRRRREERAGEKRSCEGFGFQESPLCREPER
jgi:hypothetical protein